MFTIGSAARWANRLIEPEGWFWDKLPPGDTGPAPITGSGSASSTSTATATAEIVKQGAGVAASTSTATATAVKVLVADGTATSTSTATGSAVKALIGAGAAASTSTATATALIAIPGAGAASSSSTATASAVKVLVGDGTATSASTATATAVKVLVGAGTASSVSTAVSSNVFLIPDRALSKTATASSFAGGTYAPGKAVDNDAGTRWAADNNVDGEWWKVDLGVPYLVDRIDITWEDAYAATYDILTSLDDVTYTIAASVSIGSPGYKSTTFAPVFAKYVKVQQNTRGTIYGTSIWTANVYATTRPDLAQFKTATASSIQGIYVPEWAVDYNLSTRWSSNFIDNVWWKVDLGSVQSINEIQILWEAAYGATYDIYTSTDDSSYTLAASITNSSAGLKQHIFPRVDARYVRIDGLTRGTAFGFSFYNVEVFTPIPIMGAGSASATSSASASAVKVLVGDSAAVGASTATATAVKVLVADGAAAGVSSATATGALAILGAGSATSASSATATAEAVTGYEAKIISTAGLVGYWRLGESSGTNANDEIGTNDGTLDTGVSFGATGIISGDTAASFDGSADGQIGFSNPSLTGDFSLEAWVYNTGPGLVGANQWGSIFGYSGTRRLLFDTGDNDGRVLAQMGGDNLLTPTDTVTQNEWYHIVYTYGSGTEKIYVNGVEKASQSTASGPNWNAAFFVGATANPAGSFIFKGIIDEPAIYNVALSPTVILEHYDAADVAITGAGAASSTSSASASAVKVLVGAGTAAGVSTATASAALALVGAGAASSSSSAAATGYLALVGAGTASSSSSATASAVLALLGAGVASSTSSATADAIKVLVADGTATSASSATASALLAFVGAGSASSTSSASADAIKILIGEGSASAISAAIASVYSILEGEGSASATSSATASALKVLLGAGSASSTSNASADALKLLLGAGAANSASSATASAAATILGAAAASSSSSATADAVLVLIGAAISAAVSTATATGEIADTDVPIPDITAGPTKTRISRVAGVDVTEFTIQSNETYVEYKLKVVPSGASLHTEGTLIESNTGTFPASTDHNLDVTADELVDAGLSDGDHVVKVFVKDTAGNWSA